MEEECEMKTPLTSKSKDGEDLQRIEEESCGSCSQIIIES
jgi:hypothetical protein